MNVVAIGGMLSLLPIILALILAFKTKEAVFSLLFGCVVGVLLASYNPTTGMSQLFQSALGNGDFIWVAMIEVSIGVMIAFYMKAGVIGAFADSASHFIKTRRGASGLGWCLGVLIFFSDYFSPLFAGPIARPLTDKYKISREMLAYQLDSGSAPVCTLIPISGWAVYIAGLLKGYGPIVDANHGMSVFIASIPYNFYGWLAILLCGLIAFQIIPNFGPMKAAEKRALEEGKVYGDYATPLTGKEMEDIELRAGKTPSLLFFLFVPVAIVVVIALGTFFVLGSTKILEAFFAAVAYQAIALCIGGYVTGVKDMMDAAYKGIKGVLPAIIILALAYCINDISKALGAQKFILDVTSTWMTPALLPFIAFITGALISFFTGTSWGTYAILIPFVLPMSFSLSGGELSTLVFVSIGAVVSGGCFGDHCSPVSDTSVLSSLGAGSDHMDHVRTQLPYALVAGGLAALGYLAIGVAL